MLYESIYAAGQVTHTDKGTTKPSPLLYALREQKDMGLRGGIYHRTQIDLTFNSNHIEGSRLSEEQTRLIFDANSIAADGGTANVDDIIETSNHFRCVDIIIDHAEDRLSQTFIKTLHKTLKAATSDSRKKWFAVGDYKRLPNEVGGMETTTPENVRSEMAALLRRYNATRRRHSLDDILDFHCSFERIHPFQDGNGRIGRLIMFKECLAAGIVPFIITDALKPYYYRGISQWQHVKGFLTDTCLSTQDDYKRLLDYFRIPY